VFEFFDQMKQLVMAQIASSRLNAQEYSRAESQQHADYQTSHEDHVARMKLDKELADLAHEDNEAANAVYDRLATSIDRLAAALEVTNTRTQ